MALKVAKGAGTGGAAAPGAGFSVEITRFDLRRLEYSFQGKTHGFPPLGLLAFTIFIGVVGGAYGVGGGAIIAPLLVSIWDLPVHTIAGATLTSTFLTSVVGVIFFAIYGPLAARPDLSPDWLLGGLLGAGGLLGMYLGARAQKHLPARAIETMLALVVTGTALKYLAGYFL